MNIEELKRLAEDATPGPWSDRCGVLRGEDGNVKPIATIYRAFNSSYIAAVNPATVLELIQQRDELLEALREIAEWTERYTTPGHPISTVARAAIAKAEKQ